LGAASLAREMRKRQQRCHKDRYTLRFLALRLSFKTGLIRSGDQLASSLTLSFRFFLHKLWFPIF
jgi:hypothetical protein